MCCVIRFAENLRFRNHPPETVNFLIVLFVPGTSNRTEGSEEVTQQIAVMMQRKIPRTIYGEESNMSVMSRTKRT